MSITTSELPAKSQGRARWLTSAFSSEILISVPFLVLAAATVARLISLIAVHADTSYPESASIYAFLAALRTGTLYSNPLASPWNEQMYGPLFYALGTAFAKVAHGNPLLTAELMRSISVFAFCASAVLVGYLSWRFEGSKRRAGVAVLMALSCCWAYPFCGSARPDALAICFSIAALTVYGLSTKSSRMIFFAGVLGGTAFLVKQSALPVVFALLIDAAIARRFRRGALLVLGAVLLPILVFSYLLLTHDPILANFTAVRQAIMDWASVPRTTLSFFRVFQIAVVPLFVAGLGIVARRHSEKYRPLLIACVLAWLANLAALR